MRIYIPILLSLVACGGAPSEAVVQPVKCVTAEPLSYVCRDFAALSTADDAVTLAFKVAGRVVDVPVAKGRAVVRGELLARLDSRDVELEVEAARATYGEALSRLRRAQRLLEHGAISQQEVETIESAVVQASSAYDYARGMLADMSIVAPFDGVVERVYVDAFQRVAAGESVVRVVTPRSTTVGFTAPEGLVGSLDSPTTHFSVVFDAWPDVSFKAVIKSFARTSSDALGFPVSLRLVDVDDALYSISPGMTCVVTVAMPESDRDAVLLPLEAIYAPVGGGCYVWVVEDDVVSRRAVVLGSLAGDDAVVVLHGVESGDRVVVAGVYRLYDGQRVRVIE
ncbi:MAG: efflux RND transporter periplasmic adaptor subunit [Alistipes sp.]|nr:efflux RND transporter periplasmic adaptor subunit [Alistipes sp.]